MKTLFSILFILVVIMAAFESGRDWQKYRDKEVAAAELGITIIFAVVGYLLILMK